MSFKPVKCEKCGFYKTKQNRFAHKWKCKGVKVKPLSRARPEQERLSTYEARHQMEVQA